jgi:hypothetical protein
VVDDSGPGDLEDEQELDPSEFMEDMSGVAEEDMEEDEGEEEYENEESIEMTGMPEIGEVVSLAE